MVDFTTLHPFDFDRNLFIFFSAMNAKISVGSPMKKLTVTDSAGLHLGV